ncbi:hypothetical protein O3E_01575 [Candidatus Portiera aleyrodidarum MED (Bemisia tabaci)]|uniref:Transmembrane protein n=1 Tax=Candidatus Portiera aleyrodidarum MED (Bemisia tabaci) TaxID=1163752 RepID=A0AAU8S7C0_9GAMM|nr:hypothetical protein O3E_01575 [Candidatus Portiera aleyrodidarum MED (Bemisia tabaci)]
MNGVWCLVLSVLWLVFSVLCLVFGGWWLVVGGWWFMVYGWCYLFCGGKKIKGKRFLVKIKRLKGEGEGDNGKGLCFYIKS